MNIHEMKKIIEHNATDIIDIMSQMAVWLSGNALVSTNVVALRWARLVLGWVTVRVYTILVFNQNHPGQSKIDIMLCLFTTC